MLTIIKIIILNQGANAKQHVEDYLGFICHNFNLPHKKTNEHSLFMNLIKTSLGMAILCLT